MDPPTEPKLRELIFPDVCVTYAVSTDRDVRRDMIESFRDKRTAKFASGLRVRAFSGFARQAEKALDRLDAATDLRDLAALPGNRLEALSGKRRGQYSIRINDQWRICFEWPAGSPGPLNVEIVDYH
jgi:proteic killer suppression protein